MSAWRKRLKRMAWMAGIALLLWLACSFVVAHHLTRRARARFDEPAPALAWGKVRELRLSCSDGEEVGGWFIEGRQDRPVVLLLHGNGSCRSAFLEQAEMVAAEGGSVLLVSLRAHGDSTGEFNDFGFSARRDVVAAVAWLEANHAGRPIVVWGQSLGSAAAVFAAGELGGRVRGYILESPYRDLRTAMWNRLQLSLPAVLDHVAYAGLLAVSPAVLPEVDRISPLEAVGGIPPAVPVLILSGSADRRATPEEARALADRVQGRVELVTIAGGDHGGLHRPDPAGYRKVVTGFIKGCSPDGQR